jgi:hypothetical protein
MLVLGCVDLTPPWEKNRGSGGAQDGPQVTDTGGFAGGTGGGGNTGGIGGSESIDAAVSSAEVAEPNVDAPIVPDALDASSVLPDTPLSGGGSGGNSQDAGGDGPRGGAGAGGTGGSAAGGSRTGGISSSTSRTGGTASTGGSAAGASATGGASSADAGVADAASHCVGYVGSPVDGGLSGGLAAYYSCDQSSGPTLIDRSGNGMDATLGSAGTGGASGAYSFSTGKTANAVSFVATNKGYATLPTDLLDGFCEVTVATWVYIKSSPNWQRVWDFGRDTTTYMFLTTNNGGQSLKFAITIDGNQSESSVTTDGLPLNVWKHVALVLGSSGATLFVDGQQKANNPSVKLRPADLGSGLKNYIGQSQFSTDPYLDGGIDEFRVYGRALSAAEIQALFAGS